MYNDIREEKMAQPRDGIVATLEIVSSRLQELRKSVEELGSMLTPVLLSQHIKEEVNATMPGPARKMEVEPSTVHRVANHFISEIIDINVIVTGYISRLDI